MRQKIALISDIHGNFVSLEAVLADIEQSAVDQIICLGDVAATGPQPKACLARLQALNCPVVMGNTDEWLLNPDLSDDPDEITHLIEQTDLWCAQQLSPADLTYIRAFQPIVETPLDDKNRLICFHGSPQSNRDIIQATTAEAALEGMLGEWQATVMAGGHTHEPMLRRYQNTLLLNPGSVGLPYAYDRKTGQIRNPGWAEYAWLMWADGQLSLELRRISVNIEAIAQTIRNSGMPQAELWAADWG